MVQRSNSSSDSACGTALPKAYRNCFRVSETAFFLLPGRESTGRPARICASGTGLTPLIWPGSMATAADACPCGQQLLRDQAAEGVADDDGLGAEPVDHAQIARGDVVDAVVADGGRVLPGLGHGGGVTRPSRGDRVVAGLPVEIRPVPPGIRVDPEPMDEDDRGGDRG